MNTVSYSYFSLVETFADHVSSPIRFPGLLGVILTLMRRSFESDGRDTRSSRGRSRAATPSYSKDPRGNYGSSLVPTTLNETTVRVFTHLAARSPSFRGVWTGVGKHRDKHHMMLRLVDLVYASARAAARVASTTASSSSRNASGGSGSGSGTRSRTGSGASHNAPASRTPRRTSPSPHSVTPTASPVNRPRSSSPSERGSRGRSASSATDRADEMSVGSVMDDDDLEDDSVSMFSSVSTGVDRSRRNSAGSGGASATAGGGGDAGGDYLPDDYPFHTTTTHSYLQFLCQLLMFQLQESTNGVAVFQKVLYRPPPPSTNTIRVSRRGTSFANLRRATDPLGDLDSASVAFQEQLLLHMLRQLELRPLEAQYAECVPECMLSVATTGWS